MREIITVMNGPAFAAERVRERIEKRPIRTEKGATNRAGQGASQVSSNPLSESKVAQN